MTLASMFPFCLFTERFTQPCHHLYIMCIA